MHNLLIYSFIQVTDSCLQFWGGMGFTEEVKCKGRPMYPSQLAQYIQHISIQGESWVNLFDTLILLNKLGWGHFMTTDNVEIMVANTFTDLTVENIWMEYIKIAWNSFRSEQGGISYATGRWQNKQFRWESVGSIVTSDFGALGEEQMRCFL